MRTFYRLMLTAIVMAALSQGNMHAQTKWTELNSWDFRKANETEWRKVTLPHSCNAIDGQSARYCLHRRQRASQQAFSAGCAGIIYTRLSILSVVRKCNVMYFDTKLTIFPMC